MTPANHAQPEARLRALGLLAGVLVLPLLVGCPGSLEGPFPSASVSGGAAGSAGGTGGTSGVCDAPATIFAPKCSFCHMVGGTTPDLGGPDYAGALINKMPTFPCPGLPMPQFFVNPAKPAGGVLFPRITGGTCSDQMPLGGPIFLTPAEVQCVTDWVTSNLP